jgi:hypothetical protein
VSRSERTDPPSDFSGTSYLQALIEARLRDIDEMASPTSLEDASQESSLIDIPAAVIARIEGEVRGATQALIASGLLTPADARRVLDDFGVKLREKCLIDEFELGIGDNDPPPQPPELI